MRQMGRFEAFRLAKSGFWGSRHTTKNRPNMNRSMETAAAPENFINFQIFLLLLAKGLASRKRRSTPIGAFQCLQTWYILYVGGEKRAGGVQGVLGALEHKMHAHNLLLGLARLPLAAVVESA